MYRIMQIQLDTTLIHMAVSDRPMYTSVSVVARPSIGLADMMFLLSIRLVYHGKEKQRQRHTNPSKA